MVVGPPLKIGVDIGGVCSSKAVRYENDKIKRLEVGFDIPNCLKALEILKAKGHKLYIVSFCGYKRAEETRKIFQKKYTHLFEEAFFVKKRPYKHQIALHLGLDVMIDDIWDILRMMNTVFTLLKKYLKISNNKMPWVTKR